MYFVTSLSAINNRSYCARTYLCVVSDVVVVVVVVVVVDISLVHLSLLFFKGVCLGEIYLRMSSSLSSSSSRFIY